MCCFLFVHYVVLELLLLGFFFPKVLLELQVTEQLYQTAKDMLISLPFVKCIRDWLRKKVVSEMREREREREWVGRRGRGWVRGGGGGGGVLA